MGKPKISIIIRTYNEEKTIGNCLNAVFNQKTKFSFEVIIVDSGSTDNTLKIISRFPLKIVKIKHEEFTYGKSLNVGCSHAQGGYFVFLSAHALPNDEKWLDYLIGNFENLKVAGIYGKQIPAKDCNPLTKRLMIDHWKDDRKIQSKKPFFANPNSAIRQDLWEITKFNETLDGSEDHDWAKQAQKRGYVIVYEPKAVVYHSHNENFKQIYKRYYREIYSNLLIQNKILAIKYLSDCFYNFFKDTIFIFKNNQNVKWVVRSFVNSFLLFVALSSALLQMLLKRKKYY